MTINARREMDMTDKALIEQMIADVGAENVMELFGQFKLDVNDRMSLLDALVNSHGDPAAMRLHAHSLKGLCRTYGAPEGAEVALALEQACDTADHEAIAKCYELLVRNLPATVDAAETLAAELVVSAS